ncbi:cytochrome c oxidase subunit II transmembrane domain-containing protein [Thioalkalivibrio sp. ARh3]|uniref:cytochrome c oxidase subunit II transmembrane domain-containing protein n=1 Tax=Thioalkalivibrio sp. ARh3 TaxID=1158148 RepID=UPI00035FC212|nr:cytochrome c oxidase subunit II transmembrane domain-containing protein [Thioalkalivibrio sp. ARh3]
MNGMPMLIFVVCVATGVVVFSVMLHSVLWHHRTAGANAARFHSNAAVEIVWTLIPIAIVVAMAMPAMRVLLAPEERPATPVGVTGDPLYGHAEQSDQAARVVGDAAIPQQRVRELEDQEEHFPLAVDTSRATPNGQPKPIRRTASEPIRRGWLPDRAVKRAGASVPGLVCERDARRDSADEASVPGPVDSAGVDNIRLDDKGWC